MPAIGLAAKALDIDVFERHAREHRDTMITLLPIERRVLVAEALETLHRECIVRAFDFLQAKDIRPYTFQKPGDQIDAQANRIDIPGRDFERHERNILDMSCPANAGHPIPTDF
jgi:hypothetical protein